jgi:periplasmic protein TonB
MSAATTRPHRPTAWRVAVALATMLHLAAGVSLWLPQQRGHPEPGTAPGHATSRQVWTVLPRTTASAPPEAPHQATLRWASPDSETRLATARSSPDALPASSTTVPDTRPSSSDVDASAPESASPAPHAEPPYYPRPDLDLGPAPRAPVLIGFPSGVEPGARHIGRLSLFIDETGTVRKVEILPTEPPLPQPMQDAARLAFLQAQFSPGQRQGAIVRSRIDIEVTFDDRPTDSLEAEARSTSAQRPTSPGA